MKAAALLVGVACLSWNASAFVVRPPLPKVRLVSQQQQEGAWGQNVGRRGVVQVASSRSSSSSSSSSSSESTTTTTNSVQENLPLYATVVALQALPALPTFSAEGNRVACLAFFWTTAVLAIAAGAQRPRLDGNPGLSSTSALLAPVISSVSLFGLYTLLKYTDFDPTLIYRVAVTGLGLVALQELGAEALGAVLPPPAKAALDGTPLDRFLSPDGGGGDGCADGDNNRRAPVATNVLGPVEELGALALGAAIVVAYFALPVSQSFALANVIGVAIALSTLPLLDLRTFVIGASFLLGLLCYDFFWVFRSDVMMTVATTIEAPVKFEFPTADPTRPFSILGLGDVVIPGSFVALMRDVDGQLAPEGSPSQAEASSSSSSLAAWNGPYFSTALAGYGLGLGLTFVANEVTKAGQPALVYIVPLVLGSVLLTAARRGEVGELFAFEATRDDLGA